MEESLRQRTGSLFALLGVEAAFQSRAVNGDLLRAVVVGNRQTAGSVGSREESKREISAAADQLHFAHTGQQIGGFEVNLFASQRPEFVQRLLNQPVIAHPQFARERQAARPVLFVGGIGSVRQTHPRHQRRLVLVVRIGGTLGGIGIKAEVQHMKAGVVRREGERIPVHMPQQVAVVVNRAASSRQREMLGAEQQHVIAADGFDGRALPHISEILKTRHIELSGKSPAICWAV